MLRERRGSLALASGLFVSHQVGELLVPVIVGVVIDRAVVTGDGAALVRWMAVLVVVFAVLSTSYRWGERLLVRCLEESAHGLRLRLADRVTAVEGLRRAPTAGHAVSVASSDVEATVRVQVAVATATAAIAAVLTSAVVLLAISVPLGLVVVIGLPPVLLVLQVLVGPIERRFDEQQRDVARAAATATDLLAGLRVLKGLHAEPEAARRYRGASRRTLAASLRATRLLTAHDGLTVAVNGVFVAVIAFIGGRLAADGEISVGDFAAAVGVTQFLVGPLGRMAWAAAERATSRASAGRVEALLHAEPAVEDGGAAVPAEGGGLRLDQVAHRGLAGLTLEIEGGRMTAIAVADAADAAALVDLLGRGHDPTGGRVLLDGADYRDLRLEDLVRTVLVADHDARLFSGTVRENALAVAADTARLPAVLVAAAAEEVVDSLPGGLDTEITERGRSLSGGQRQRVALARALAAESEVLVLHDPTTAVDAVTEAHIAGALRELRAGRTTVVVATSPTLLAVADEVVLVDEGRVVDRGTHAELARRSNRYVSVVLA